MGAVQKDGIAAASGERRLCVIGAWTRAARAPLTWPQTCCALPRRVDCYAAKHRAALHADHRAAGTTNSNCP